MHLGIGPSIVNRRHIVDRADLTSAFQRAFGSLPGDKNRPEERNLSVPSVPVGFGIPRAVSPR